MSLTITIVQSDVMDTRENTYRHIEEMIRDSHSDFYVLTEVFSTGFDLDVEKYSYSDNGKEAIDWMCRVCKEKNCGMVGGIVVKDGDKHWNRLIYCNENGYIAKYDKAHLWKYGCEKALDEGHERVIVSYRGVRMLFITCYDTRFPAFVRCHNDYDIIINPINYPVKVYKVSLCLAAARAIENMTWVFCSNRVGQDGINMRYNGHSSVFDPSGRCVAEAGENEELVTVTFVLKELQQYRSVHSFGKYFDNYVLEHPYNEVRK